MALISIRKTAAIEPAPTDTVSLYVDASDNHLKQIDENGNIIDLTDGSAASSPNAASLVNTTKAALFTLLDDGLANIKATYRITDATDGIIRVTAKTASLLTATAMKEGSDNGTGTVTDGEWGNYDLDSDVFTATVPYLLAQLKVGQFTYDTIPTLTTLCNQFGGTFAITDATDWSITILRTGGISITGDAFAQISVALIGAIPLPVFAQSSALDSLGGTINFLQYDGAVPPTTDPIDSFVVNIYGYA